jgi:phosphatidylcholine synthase
MSDAPRLMPRTPPAADAAAERAARAGAPGAASRLRVAAAWAIHAYTASGAVLAFLALWAIGEGRFPDAFRWLLVAMAIDCTDGTLARAVAVKRVVPEFDGTKLDDIIDYVTYVLVPVMLIFEAGLFPRPIAPLCAAVPLLASAYGFCRTDAKTEDHYFRGFPSYWNVVAFYAYALALSPVAVATWVLGLSLLVFAPLKFIYPSRAPRYRTLTIVLGAGWAVLMIVAVWTTPVTPRPLLWATLLYPIYYAALSLWAQLSDGARAGAR